MSIETVDRAVVICYALRMTEFFESNTWDKIVYLFNKTSRLLFEHDTLRQGQAYMNVLYDLDQSAYNAVRETDLDPYYDDERINAMLKFLTERWMKEDEENK